MTEHAKARAWRERLGLTRKQLADLTGYSYESVLLFERGTTPSRTWSTNPKKMKPKAIDDFVWQRYRRCCQAVDHELRNREPFSW